MENLLIKTFYSSIIKRQLRAWEKSETIRAQQQQQDCIRVIVNAVGSLFLKLSVKTIWSKLWWYGADLLGCNCIVYIVLSLTRLEDYSTLWLKNQLKQEVEEWVALSWRNRIRQRQKKWGEYRTTERNWRIREVWNRERRKNE